MKKKTTSNASPIPRNKKRSDENTTSSSAAPERVRNKARADDKTTVTFSLEKKQQEALKRIAATERRTLSNWLQVVLDEEIARRRAKGEDI